MTDLSKLSDAELQSLYSGTGAGKSVTGMSDDELKAAYGSPAPQGFMANAADFVKSIPRGLITGLTSAPNPSMVPIDDELAAVAPTSQAAAETLKAPLPTPQGSAGKIGEAVGEGLGNPVSYLGPGGLALKVGGAALSSAASEGAGQAAEGTPYEAPARLAGALAGGVAAAKTLGPRAPKAENPTYRELKDDATSKYTAARNTGFELHPRGVSSFGTKVEQELSGPNHGFTGGTDGVAPKTFAVLQRIQNPPPGASVTASNVDALRKNLGMLSRETDGGKPTPDAAAASIALKRLNEYLESPPPGHVVAGDAQQYIRLTKEANANYAAGQRVRDWQTRLDNAELDANGQIAGSLENRQKIAARQILKSPNKSRGYDATEKDQLKLINDGGPGSNFLRQAGRGGAGVIPIMGQLAASGPVFAAGGLPGLALQGGIAGALYGARKGSEAITNKRANKLVEMLAQRSPLYESRKASLPSPDTAAGKAAILRALLSQ